MLSKKLALNEEITIDRMNRRKTLSLLLILPFLVLLYSCHPLFCNWGRGYSQLTYLPSNDSIIGTYELTTNSKEFIQNKGLKSSCQIILMDSGKYIVKEIPELILNYYSKKTDNSFITKKGKWFVSCDSSSYCMIELEGILVMPLAKKNNGAISILMTIGDGDECNGVVFERIRK